MMSGWTPKVNVDGPGHHTFIDGAEGLSVGEGSGGRAVGPLVSQAPWVPGVPYRASMVSTAWSTALVTAESSGSQRASSIRGQNT